MLNNILCIGCVHSLKQLNKTSFIILFIFYNDALSFCQQTFLAGISLSRATQFSKAKEESCMMWPMCLWEYGATQGPYLRCIWLPDRSVLVRARRGWSWVIITELFSVSSALGNRWDERPLHKTLPWCSLVSGSVLACPRLPGFHRDLTNL